MSGEIINTVAIRGGFIARSMVIVPNERRPPNPMMDDVDDDAEIQNLVNSLRQISEMRGEFSISDGAKLEYEGWYKGYYSQYIKKPDPTGIYGRMHESILKLAMIHSAVDLTLEMRKCHMEAAIDEGIKLFPNYQILAMSGGRATTAAAGELILKALLGAHGYQLTASELMREHWSTIGDLDMLDKVTNAFIVAKHVERITEGSVVIYKLTSAFLDKMGWPEVYTVTDAQAVAQRLRSNLSSVGVK